MLRKADLGGLSALNMKCGTTRAVSMLGRGQSGFDCNGNQTDYKTREAALEYLLMTTGSC